MNMAKAQSQCKQCSWEQQQQQQQQHEAQEASPIQDIAGLDMVGVAVVGLRLGCRVVISDAACGEQPHVQSGSAELRNALSVSALASPSRHFRVRPFFTLTCIVSATS
jgi:hypothetical protein